MPKLAFGGQVTAPVGKGPGNTGGPLIKPPPPGVRTPAAPVGKPTVTGAPKPPPSGPMVPVRGGGMAPASAATTMKKGGTTRRNKK